MRLRPTRSKLSVQARAAALRGVALLTLLAHGTGVAHHLLERHELCAEHGELVHGGAAHGHGAPGMGGISPNADEPGASGVVRAGGETAEHGHEHCGLACSRGKLNVGAQASTALLELGVAQLVAEPNAVATRDGGVLRHLAPKLSPPA